MENMSTAATWSPAPSAKSTSVWVAESDAIALGTRWDFHVAPAADTVTGKSAAATVVTGAEVVGEEVASGRKQPSVVGVVLCAACGAGCRSPVEHATTIARDTVAKSHLFIRRPPSLVGRLDVVTRHDTPFHREHVMDLQWQATWLVPKSGASQLRDSAGFQPASLLRPPPWERPPECPGLSRAVPA